jgi:hypothetical protein
MKTLTSIQNTEKYTKAIFLISLLVFQLALKASDPPADLEEVFETQQKVEEWMLDLSTWAKYVRTYSCSQSSETEGKIEDWMTDPNNAIWDDNEEEYEIEEWMCDVNHKNWKKSSSEKEYKIEKWMTNTSTWLNSDKLLQASAY